MRLLREECNIKSLEGLKEATGGDWSSVVLFPDDDRGAKPASGSQRTAGMVICPCSMGTVAAIAGGTSRSLVERAADVTLKERRKLILVPRETPLSLVHLRNLVTVTEAGAVVIPAAPGFYHRPTRVSELVDFIVQRVLDQLGIEIEIARRWGGDQTVNATLDHLRRLGVGRRSHFVCAAVCRRAAATATISRARASRPTAAGR